MIAHFFTLLTRPERAWVEIGREEARSSSGHLAYLLLFALLPTVCLFIGTRFVGWSLVEDERIRLETFSALQLSLLLYLTIVAGVFVMGAFLRWMSRTFEARPTYNQCVGFIAYVCTPFFIAGLGALYPTRWIAITVLLLAGLHASYLLYVGLPKFMHIGYQQAFLYAVSAWGVGLLVMVNLLVGMILFWMLMLDPTYQRSVQQDQGYGTQEQRPQDEPGER
jgi:hypothetical protein